MLNMVRNVIALELASYAGERLWAAGKAGYQAFQAAREDRRPTYRPVNLNAAGGHPGEPETVSLRPFKVQVALRGQPDYLATHVIYAICADEASSWAQGFYGHIRGELQITAVSVN